VTYPLTVKNQQKNDHWFQNDQQDQTQSHITFDPESNTEQSEADIGPTPSELPEDASPLQPTLGCHTKIKNAIKRFLRPSISPGFERHEWICVSLPLCKLQALQRMKV
jgi:hypothetical protein